MREIQVTVITNTELGWDCVVAVERGYLEAVDFLDEDHPEDAEYQDDSYVFTHETLHIG